MAFVLRQLFGTAGPVDTYQMSGKTDSHIIMDLLTAVGIDRAKIKARLPAIYERMAEKGQEIFPLRNMQVCAGIPELLTALNQRNDVLLGLLTGNAQLTAPVKLLAAGIDPAQFKVGAYGSDAVDRNQLPAISISRANQLTGHEFGGNNTIIIGDTPADILCARSGRAMAIAVASGWHSTTTLAKYRPDYLFDDLTDTAQIIEALLGK
jgi:phosphoglycolate phosphatase